MARKTSSSGPGKRPVVVVVAKRGEPSGERMRGERLRGGDGHKLGGRPHAADARRDIGRDPFKASKPECRDPRDRQKG